MSAALTQVDKCVLISYDRYQDLLDAYKNRSCELTSAGSVGEGTGPPPPPSRARPQQQNVYPLEKSVESSVQKQAPGKALVFGHQGDVSNNNKHPASARENEYSPPGITGEHLDASKIRGSGSGTIKTKLRNPVQSQTKKKKTKKKTQKHTFVWKW